MRGYLLDTKHLGQAVTSGSDVRRRLEELRLQGMRIGTALPARCEIEVGIQQVRSPEAYRLNLRRLVRHVRLWPLDIETAQIYGELYVDLRNRGRSLSQVDLMLAALATQRNLVLLTSDRDFEALPRVRTENWLPLPPV